MRENKSQLRFEGFYWAIAIVVSLRWTELRQIFSKEYSEVPLQTLLDGTAPRLWQCRALFISAARVMTPWISPKVFFSALEGLSLLTSIYLFRRFLFFFVPLPKTCALLSFTIVPTLLFHFVLPHRSAYYYPWDLPSVAFGLLLCQLQLRQFWVRYFLVFALATLNRESSALWLVLLFLTTPKDQLRTSNFIFKALSLFAIWILIRVGLLWVYKSNPGQSMIGPYWNPENATFLSSLTNYPYLMSAYAFLWLPSLIFRDQIKNSYLQQATLLFWVSVAIIWFTGVNVYELRSFGEISFIFLAAALTLLLDTHARERFGPDPNSGKLTT